MKNLGCSLCLYNFEIYHINEEKHNNNLIFIILHYAICSHFMLSAPALC